MLGDFWWNICCRCLQSERPANVLQLIAVHTENRGATELEQTWLVDALEQCVSSLRLLHVALSLQRILPHQRFFYQNRSDVLC